MSDSNKPQCPSALANSNGDKDERTQGIVKFNGLLEFYLDHEWYLKIFEERSGMLKLMTSRDTRYVTTLDKSAKMPRIPNGKFKRATLILLALTFLGVTMAQAQDSLEDFKKRKAFADAETETIQSEIKRDEARKKQSEMVAPIDPAKKEKDDAVESAKSAKAIADAKKAQFDSELAALKAQYGEVPDSGIKGSVELGDKAGSMETALLAAGALTTAAERTAEAIKGSLNHSTTVLIFPGGEVPDFKALSGFRALRPTMLNQFTNALTASEHAKEPTTEVPLIPAIGVAVSTVTKLLSFFASDFKIGGSELTPDSILLAEAVGGKLQKLVDPGTKIFLTGVFNPVDQKTYDDFFATELKPLSEQYEKVIAAIRDRERDIASLNDKLTKLTGDTTEDRAEKLQIAEKLKLHQDAVEKLNGPAQAYGVFMSKLTGADGGLEVLIRQFEMSSLLSKGSSYVLVVKMHKAGGSHYIEKNLWTSFGKMPFKVMGGVVVSYSLFDGKSTNLVASGVFPVHGGFHNPKELGELLN